MGLAPEITGIGSQINPAILFAYAVKVNMERELTFPGKTLQFFEKSPPPDGDTELLELIVDWCARRVKPSLTRPLITNLWEFEIIETSDLTDAISNKTAYMMIGELKFKGVKRDSPAGSIGNWKFITETI